jgi:hypothetical protein
MWYIFAYICPPCTGWPLCVYLLTDICSYNSVPLALYKVREKAMSHGWKTLARSWKRIIKCENVISARERKVE